MNSDPVDAAASLRLADLPVGEPATITEIRGGRHLTRRLLGLGLRVGSTVIVLYHRGSGVVLARDETRLALGGGVVEKLWVRRPSHIA
jgi:ferrous iron transport protein A